MKDICWTLLSLLIYIYIYLSIYLASFFPSEWLKSNKLFVTKSFPTGLLPLLLPPSNSKQLAEKSLANEEPRMRRYLKTRQKKSKYVLEFEVVLQILHSFIFYREGIYVLPFIPNIHCSFLSILAKQTVIFVNYFLGFLGHCPHF